MNRKYTTLLFDADNTLIDFSRSERQSLINTFEHYAVPVTEENIRVYSTINQALWKRLERGEITKPELKRIRFRSFFESIGFEAEVDSLQVNEYYLSRLSGCGYTMEGAYELLRELKASGYDIYIITNGIAKTQASRLEKSGLMPFISAVFVSESVGIPKPAREFFDYVFKNIPEKDKSKMLVIGDSLSSDIKGAMNSGIPSVWLSDKPDTLTEEYSPDYIITSLSQLKEVLG